MHKTKTGSCTAVLKSASDDSDIATFVASDGSVDRMGDVIEPSGWKLDNFRKNPVLLYGHNSSALPVGRVADVRVSGKNLIAKVEFLRQGIDDFADKVRTLVKEGWLRSVSVGFRALKYEPLESEKGYRFIEQELVEISIVPVPANANALAVARSIGCTDQQIGTLFSPGGANAKRRAIQRHRVKLLRARG